MASEIPAITIAVCISTLHRPAGLEQTLRSVAKQRDSLPIGHALMAVVVSNDPDDPEPKQVVMRVAKESGLPIEFAVEPHRGVAPPRNCALGIAQTAVGAKGLIAFIDDDEVADHGWLAELLSVKLRWGAAIVTGPVVPTFDHQPADWIVRGGFFAPTVLQTGASRRWAFTNNVLFDAALLASVDRWFDPHYLRAGEDRHFFQRLAARGARIVWAANARVTESIPPARACAPWLVRRQRSVGRCVAPIERDLYGAPYAVLNCSARGIACIGLGSVLTLVGCLSKRRRVRGLMWTAWGIGLIEGVWRPSVAGAPVSIAD